MIKIIDGKLIAANIKDEVKKNINALKEDKTTISLAVILVGEDKASKIYVENKKKACEFVGIHSISYELDKNIDKIELLNLIKKLNEDKDINGILVQLPLPSHINEEEVLLAIKPEKDVDCFNPHNVGLLALGKPKLKPCTPAGIVDILKHSNVSIESKICVVVGRSNIVGKPMAQLLLQEDATVIICHSKTKNLKELCKKADILICAIGKANFITSDMIKEDAVVIDVGMNRDENGKLCGDVDFKNVLEVCCKITPVPGGVGPMTIAKLMQNCLAAYKIQNKIVGDTNEFSK
jgi:methylenetetrahydrofolate dehydrogenase (NADP+) / methenyltetrahydrofolate cyclohydrolase